MKLIVLSLLAATCSAAPQLYQTVAGTVASPQWNLPAVMKIPEPGVNLGMVLTAPAPVPVVKAAPVPVPVVKAAPSLTVVEAAPVAVALLPRWSRVQPLWLLLPLWQSPLWSRALSPSLWWQRLSPSWPLNPPCPPSASLTWEANSTPRTRAGQYTFGHYGGPKHPRGDQGLFGSYRQLRLRGPRGRPEAERDRPAFERRGRRCRGYECRCFRQHYHEHFDDCCSVMCHVINSHLSLTVSSLCPLSSTVSSLIFHDMIRAFSLGNFRQNAKVRVAVKVQSRAWSGR
nr:uncharacterized protein LOC113813131 [Penaeus vannamei]